MSAKRALAYCSIFELGNQKKWRIPSSNELLSIIDRNRIPTIKSTFNYSSVGCTVVLCYNTNHE